MTLASNALYTMPKFECLTLRWRRRVVAFHFLYSSCRESNLGDIVYKRFLYMALYGYMTLSSNTMTLNTLSDNLLFIGTISNLVTIHQELHIIL